jgi:hypothetical protein
MGPGARLPLATAIKHRSIAQRYRGGVPWEKTDLFRAYARRLAAGDHVRGARTMEQLLAQYYTRVDGMFADMKARGFRPRRRPACLSAAGAADRPPLAELGQGPSCSSATRAITGWRWRRCWD